MLCKPGFHQTPTGALFGGAVSNIDPSVMSCAPDQQYDSFSPFKIAQAVAGVLFPLVSVPGLLENAPTKILTGVEDALELTKQERQYVDTGLSVAQTFLSSGADIMGFFDDFSFDFVVDSFDDMMDGVDWGSLAGAGLEVGTNFLTASNQPRAVPAMSKVPAVVGAVGGAVARSGAVVGRSFFNKWPNLATAIQKMKNAGHTVSRSKLYSMLKRFGPEFLVTAGIMSAAAVSELALAGPGHRRMNPANGKALRRATRRIKSFHRLCGDADVIKKRSCRKKC
jgi:hypothetical protein